MVHDEVITFDLGDFLADWKDETIKVFSYRESIVDQFIEAFFRLKTEPAIQLNSRTRLQKRATLLTLLKSALFTISARYGSSPLASTLW